MHYSPINFLEILSHVNINTSNCSSLEDRKHILKIVDCLEGHSEAVNKGSRALLRECLSRILGASASASTNVAAGASATATAAGGALSNSNKNNNSSSSSGSSKSNKSNKSDRVSCDFQEADRRSSLAVAFMHQGKLTEALREYESALTIYNYDIIDGIGSGGGANTSNANITNIANSVDSADTYHSIGQIYCEQGKFHSALDNYKIALQSKLPHYGEDHPEVGMIYHDMGTAYSKNGQFKEAVQLYVSMCLCCQGLCLCLELWLYHCYIVLLSCFLLLVQ